MSKLDINIYIFPRTIILLQLFFFYYLIIKSHHSLKLYLFITKKKFFNLFTKNGMLDLPYANITFTHHIRSGSNFCFSEFRTKSEV